MAKTVRDLMADLEELDPDMIVALASDPEGNSVNLWGGDYSVMKYDPTLPADEEITEWVYGDDDEERPISDDEANGIILWP